MPKLVIERGRKWDVSELSPRTIALDGAVEGPYLDAENEIFSFDHHGDCIRGVTLSTCEQVRDFILLGLDVTGYTVLLNDIDLDSALSAWLLEYPNRVSEPIIEKLVYSAGRQDVHAGAYPTTKAMQEILDWIAAPEVRMRNDSTYENASPDFLEIVLEAIWRRIEQYADGQTPSDIGDKSAEEIEEDEDYEQIMKGTGWRLVRSSGERALRGLSRDNVNRYVIVRDLSTEVDGKTVESMCVTVGKRSEVITGFPVGPSDRKGTILWALEQAEPDRAGKTDVWGGSTTIGGSPRNEDGTGTLLSVEEIFKIVEGVVTKSPAQRKKKARKARKKE